MENPGFIESAKVPNFFYDLIVFMTPSLSLTFGVLIGLGKHGFPLVIRSLGLLKIEGFDVLLLFIFFFVIFLFLAYEYGRLAEALSSWAGDIVKFCRRKNWLFVRQKDYSIDFKREIEKLNLPYNLDDDRMDKWTIYFYTMRFQTTIGSDILKRYAWEKLSRSSAFTFGTLFIVSVIMAVVRLFEIKTIWTYTFLDTGLFGFGSLAYTMTSLLLFVLTSYEYYRRRAWNNDLLIKILPVITLPNDFTIKPKTQTPAEIVVTEEVQRNMVAQIRVDNSE